MTARKGTHPFKALLDIRREELPLALVMFGYFFLVITTFWILKPIKKTLFIGYYQEHAFDRWGIHLLGSQAELLAKVMNMVVAFAAVVLFSWLARRFQRQQLTNLFSLGFILGFIAYSLVLQHPGALGVWSFYLFGDLYSTVMVAGFFAFLNDSVSPQAARRLYGLVVLGGVGGGAFGSTFVRVWVGKLAPSTWMWVCLGFALLIVVAANVGGWLVHRLPVSSRESKPGHRCDEEVHGGNPAIEGARLVAKSRYLLSLVAIVGLYEIVSTLMDFQFTATLEHYLEGEALGRQFATVYAITNISSLAVQMGLTSFVMTRFRLTVALFVLPLAIVGASAAFLIVPLLWFGSALNTADNAISYSLNQSAKEALYTVTTRDEKYKAKAFIDMFVQRFAKALAVGVSLLVTMLFARFSTIRWLSLFSMAVAVVWMGAATHAGREFHRRSQTGGAAGAPGIQPTVPSDGESCSFPEND